MTTNSGNSGPSNAPNHAQARRVGQLVVTPAPHSWAAMASGWWSHGEVGEELAHSKRADAVRWRTEIYREIAANIAPLIKSGS